MLNLAAAVAAALIAWAPSLPPPTITAEWTANASAPLAQTGANLPGNRCLIGVQPDKLAAFPPDQQQNIVTHEVGHCLGLGHYGSCNWLPANMGCAPLAITDYDRFMLARVEGRTARLFIPQIGY